MLVRSLFLSTLTFGAGAGARLEGIGRLRSLSTDYGEPPDFCPGLTVREFFAVEIELNDIVGDCDDTDFVNIGMAIQRVIDEVDEEVPVYVNEFQRTDVCTKPEGIEDVIERHLDANGNHRSLGRYAAKYLGGGTCRRCAPDNADRRRFLNEHNYVCHMADAAQFAKGIAESALSSADLVIASMNEIAAVYEDQDKVNELLGLVSQERDLIAQELDIASDATETVSGLCQDTKSDESLVEELSDEARSESNVAVESAANAHNALSTIADVKVELKEAAYRHASDTPEQLALLEEIEAEKQNLEDELSRVDAQIVDLENHLQTATSQSEQEQLKAERDALLEAEAQVDQKMNETEEFLHSREQWLEDVARAKIAVAEATTENEWSEKFINLIELYVPRHLYEVYNENGLGCLVEEPSIIVYTTPVEPVTPEDVPGKNCTVDVSTDGGSSTTPPEDVNVPPPPPSNDCTIVLRPNNNAYYAGMDIGFDKDHAELDFTGTGLNLDDIELGSSVFTSTTISGQILTLTKTSWISTGTLGYIDMHGINYGPVPEMGTFTAPKCKPF